MKNLFVLTFLLFFSLLVQSQEILNNYQLVAPQNYSSYPIGFTNPVAEFPYTWVHPQIPPGYSGEYEVFLSSLYWGVVNPNLATSYTMEVVSFPFSNECAWQTIGCANSSLTRELYLPTSIYNGTNKWGDLNRILPPRCPFNNSTHHQTLVSYAFTHNVGLNTSNRFILPHTIIKHTVNLHCGVNLSDDIILSLSWYYDNTRGRMRFYPFSNSNNSNCGESSHDVIFLPTLYSNQDSTNVAAHMYNETNNLFLMPNGTINYFPYKTNYQSGCAEPGTIYPFQTAIFSDWTTVNNDKDIQNFYNVFPPPYSLLSAPIRSNRGKYLAGLQWLGIQTNLTLPGAIDYYLEQGLRHTYHIDQNIDLTIINPSEQTIYNPSEVDVTASDLHFPSYYTFKTIRGVYPAIANVTADNNDPQTGGPYADTRDVPVRTDLRSENVNDPQDPNTPWHSVYSSRYYLKEGSKLTIEPCANIFDATFDVEEGATLLFEMQQYNLGFEHKKLNQTQNLGRYKIKGLGGAILRNYNHTQYVQNGKIKQPYNLHYKATSTILAGATVAATVDDDDQLPGNYSIEPGGDVQFTAPDLISLRDGFSAKTGCTFKAKCADPGLLQQCPQQVNGNGGNKMAPQFTQQNKTNASSGIIIPNPSNGIFTYRTINFSPENTASIEVINSMGIKLISKMIDDENTNFDITQYGKGVYYLRAMNGKNVRVEKVVVK